MLFDAVEEGDVEVARQAILHGADVNAAVGCEGETPLGRAVHNSNLGMMKLLLESGASPNLPCDDHWKSPPLFWAWDVSRAGLLMDFGASVRAECVSPHAPRNHFSVGDTSVHGAAGRGEVDLLRLLLDRGEGKLVLNQFTDLGFTPLHEAATEGHLDCIRMLLQAGADPNALDADFCGRTPLAAAVEAGADEEVLQVLLDAGADPALGVPCCGHSALQFASERKRRPELLALVERHGRRR